MPRLIFKICTAAEWRDAERARTYEGAAIDRQDGFIHFSAADQVVETAAKHFMCIHEPLVLVAVDAEALGPVLRWETSRGGALFPHLYGTLALSAVRWVKPLPVGAEGKHVFPDLAA